MKSIMIKFYRMFLTPNDSNNLLSAIANVRRCNCVMCQHQDVQSMKLVIYEHGGEEDVSQWLYSDITDGWMESITRQGKLPTYRSRHWLLSTMVSPQRCGL